MNFPSLPFKLPWSSKSSSQQDVLLLIKTALEQPKNKAVRDELARAFKKDPAGVMVQIIRHQHSEYVKEISTWKLARAEAKDVFNPRRVMLTEFYNDLVLDPFIWGVVHNKRILKISNKNFKICNRKTKENDPEKTDLLNSMWFNDFLKYAMESRFYGYSLVYFFEWRNARIKQTELVYREHVIPERGIITQRPYDSTGLNYKEAPFNQYMIGIGNPKDLGLFEKAAVHYVLKKHSWKSWDEFEEIFGIPIRILKTASQDKKVQEELAGWLRSMGSAGYGVFPMDSELDVKESKSTDAFQVFSEKVKLANEELEVLFTGQNRITQNGGAYAKEKVMQEESDEVTEDDKTFIYYVINDELLPLLRMNGYPITEDDMFEWDDAVNDKPKDRVAIFSEIHKMGYEIEQQQIESEFGVKIVGKREEQKPVIGKEKGNKGTSTPTSNTQEQLIQMHSSIQNIYVH
jgi:phage gp29-like protein